VETLRGDKDRFDALIAVLKVGFERGGVETRLEKWGERFVEEPYEVYAPRVLAGIAGLKDTLEDRARPLFMLGKRRNEVVSRLNRATDTEAQALRDQCALACLTHIQNVITAYDGAPAALEQEGIDDRAVDLWSPLVAITLVADAEDDGSRTLQLLDLARSRDRLRRRRRGRDHGPAPGWRRWGGSGQRSARRRPPPNCSRPSGPALGLAEEPPPAGRPPEPPPDRPAAVLERGRRRWCYVLDAGQLADLQASTGPGARGPPPPGRSRGRTAR